MTKEFEIKKDTDGGDIENPLNTAEQLIQLRFLPEFLEFFNGQDVLGPTLLIEIQNHIQDDYCAFVPSENSRILIRRDCLQETTLAPVFFHELQHIAENYLRVKKDDWLNEGLSELLSYRLVHLYPALVWSNIASSGQTDPLIFSRHDLHSLPADVRQSLYGTSNLFLTYLYQHFGGDEWLRKMILTPGNGQDVIETVLAKNNSVDPAVLKFNSLFLNFAVALNVNSPWGSENGMFALGGYDPTPELRGFKLQGIFEVIEPNDVLNKQLNPYQTMSFRMATHSQCLKWASISRVKVLALDTQHENQNVRMLNPNECFTLKPSESLSITSFETAATVQVSAF
jgi:hypothetical protein